MRNGAWPVDQGSPLSQGRGSKRQPNRPAYSRSESSPLSRGRGSKPLKSFRQTRNHRVAPLAGAWIETVPRSTLPCSDMVAPLAGAWIETTGGRQWQLQSVPSPLSRGRGSKRSYADHAVGVMGRPSRRGVDRNGLEVTSGNHLIRSPLSQGRGSKQLKRRLWIERRVVAPLAGAWIETQ